MQAYNKYLRPADICYAHIFHVHITYAHRAYVLRTHNSYAHYAYVVGAHNLCACT